MPGSLRFHPPWWAVALAVAGCAAGIALGNWQQERASAKRALAAALKPVTIQGEFLPGTMLFLDNKTYRGRAGYHVLQVLRQLDGEAVLVNRGWVPAAQSRARLPDVRTPAGMLVLKGLRFDHLPHALEPAGAKREGIVWQNASVDEVAAWSGMPLARGVFEQHGYLDDGLVRDWPPADSGVATHESYALQWYSLSALSVVLLLALNIRRHDAAAG